MQRGAEYVFEKSPDRVEHWAHRQRWPHSHCFVTAPSYPEVGGERNSEDMGDEVHLVPDLGQDTIWAYQIKTSNAPSVEAEGGGGAHSRCCRLELLAGAKLEPQQGPRHLVFHPRCRTAYVINELKSTVSVLHFYPERLGAHKCDDDCAEEKEKEVPVHNASSTSTTTTDATTIDAAAVTTSPAAKSKSFLEHSETLRTLPDDFESDDHHKSHASEIRLHPTGKWLLIANRGHDSIAVYSVDEENRGALSLSHITSSGGAFPRNFNFSSCGHWVIVGNQVGENTKTLRLDLSCSLV
jgi:6-phosphogluconolactonase (cycloisomerase 2 family)